MKALVQALNILVAALPCVLLVDDDAAVQKAVEFRLRGRAELIACYSANEALVALRGKQFDAALVDVNLGPGVTGIELIASIREVDPDLAAIIFTAHSNYETALGSLNVHTFDFIPKSLRDDRSFCLKINGAVLRTREQRARTQGAGEAARLRVALADAVVNNELELSSNDIHRGLLSESLYSFSTLLGQVELMDLCLTKVLHNSPEAADVAKLSGKTVAEVHDYVGKLRDYFAEPSRAISSVNGVLVHAVRVVKNGSSDFNPSIKVECGQLKPDQAFVGDGRALLRAIVILLSLVLKSASENTVVVVKPLLVFNPLLELKAIKSRSQTIVMNASNFRRDDKTAVAIEVMGPRGGMTMDKILDLMSFRDLVGSEASPWSALAMVHKLSGAFGVELKPGACISYRIFIKV